MTDKMKQLTSKYCEEMVKEALSSKDTCTNIMSCVTKVLTVMLPAAAMSGKVKSNKDYNVTQRMVYMGNQSINIAIEALVEDGKIEVLEQLDELFKVIKEK
jgi:acyl-CoA hydrolase